MLTDNDYIHDDDTMSDAFYLEQRDIVINLLGFERLSVYEICDALEVSLDDTREILDRMQDEEVIDWMTLKYKRGPVYYLLNEDEDVPRIKPDWNDGPFSIKWHNEASVSCPLCRRIHNSPVGIPEVCVCGQDLKMA